MSNKNVIIFFFDLLVEEKLHWAFRLYDQVCIKVLKYIFYSKIKFFADFSLIVFSFIQLTLGPCEIQLTLESCVLHKNSRIQ